MLGLSNSTGDRWAQLVATVAFALFALGKVFTYDERWMAMVSGLMALLLAGAAGWRARKLLRESSRP